MNQISLNLDSSNQIAYIYKPGYLIDRVLDSNLIMDKLPLTRVNPTSPFENVFIDLVGPFTINATANSNKSLDIYVSM